MANAGPNTNGSQLFFTYAPQPHLNNHHSVFGQLTLVYDVRKDAPKEKVDEFSRHIKSWFMRWGLRHSVGESYTQQGIEELLSRTHFKEAERIELDGLGMFIWLRRPAIPPS